MADLRVAFVHDHRFCRTDDGAVYSPGQFPYSTWRRYLKWFASVVVVGREHRIGNLEAEHLSRSDGAGVRFVLMPDVKSIGGFVTKRRVVKVLLAEAIDHVDAVIVRLPSTHGRMAIELARRARKPVAAEVVGCPWDACWNHGTLQGKIAAPLSSWRTKRAVVKAPFTLYVTSRFLQQRYPARGRVAVASNVEVAECDPLVLERRLRRIGQVRDPSVVGFIGALGHRYKGLETALEAIAAVGHSVPRFELRVLGPGDPRRWKNRAAQYGIESQVRWCGVLPAGPAVLAWLDAVDVFVQPSFQEGLPRALIEAMSRGCPALGSTAGGIPELLDAECLHRPGDAAFLGRQLLRAASDAGWRSRQARRNFETAKAYSADVLNARRDAFWREFADYAVTGEGSR